MFSKMGSGLYRCRDVHEHPADVAVLRRAYSNGGQWLFRGGKDSGHLKNGNGFTTLTAV